LETKLYNILKRLTKQEILKFSKMTCEHGHPLISHPNCLAKEVKFEERVGFLDIETSNFSASFGVIASWCIKQDGGKIYEGCLQGEDFEEKSGHYDKRILKDCIDTMRKFDRLVVYWGKDKRFDIPFLRTRAVTMELDFPIYQERLVSDLYDIVRMKFKLGRNSLAAACKQFGIASKDTPMSPDMWVKAIVGRDPKSMKWILQHNREDVESTEALWHRINQYSNLTKTSI